MIVAMMHVGPVSVGVDHGLVRVLVRMPPRRPRPRAMGMVMVAVVVPVPVRVRRGCMSMPVDMPFAVEKPQRHGHETGSDALARLDRLTQP